MIYRLHFLSPIAACPQNHKALGVVEQSGTGESERHLPYAGFINLGRFMDASDSPSPGPRRN